MTAIGLAFTFFGLVVLWLFGNPHDPELNFFEWLAGTCLLFGILSAVSGITMWLWRVMP